MSLRIRRSFQRPDQRWKELPLASRGRTKLGFSFRLPQAELMGLNPEGALKDLLAIGFEVVRLATLWNRIEPDREAYDWSSLDWQLELAARARVDVILAVGPVKNFGYPEFYVPTHHLREPLPEGRLVGADSHPQLAEAAQDFLVKVVERYRDVGSIVAWQVEHEALDPLGMEHSWRLAWGFVSEEVELIRRLDPARPIVLSAFLPMSRAVAMQQSWRTRDQGDSLRLALERADVVGLDLYPCHALAQARGLTAYLDAGLTAAVRRIRRVAEEAAERGRRLMVTEGQAEPWEAITNPPNPAGMFAASCPPDRLIETYNACMGAASGQLDWYLFWGAEYWLQRDVSGDPAYLQAVERVLHLVR